MRSLRTAAPAGDATRLYEVIRARPGYEAAVEAAIGENGAGVLAENLDEGMRMLSEADPVALRLDAEGVHAGDHPSGTPSLSASKSSTAVTQAPSSACSAASSSLTDRETAPT